MFSGIHKRDLSVIINTDNKCLHVPRLLTLSAVVRIGHRFCHDNWMIHYTTGSDTKVGKCVV